MQFLHPGSLWLLLLGVIPVMLYLFRRKARKVRVSNLVFFKSLAREHQESAWLRRLKKLLSFLLTMAVLIAAVVALARLALTGNDGKNVRTVVILMDRSASMAVVDENGENRLEAGKKRIRERLRQVPKEVGVSLIAYDVRPAIVQPRTLQRRELISRLDALRVRPMADQRSAAFKTAIDIASLETPAVIWHFSDQTWQNEKTDQTMPISLPDGVEMKEQNLALPEVVNPGITAFRLRPAAMESSRYDAYVQLALNRAAPHPVQTRLNVSVGGMPVQFREIDLKPGERIGMTFQISGSQNQLLRLDLKSDRDDFPLDNEVMIPLRDPGPILAAWIRPDETEDPFTRLALSTVQDGDNFELLKGNPTAWPLSEKVDVVIFDGWLPEKWPDNMAVIVINPPKSCGPVMARKLKSPIPYDSVRVGDEEHPVLFRVESSRISVTQTSIYQTKGALEPLWMAGNEPIVSAGEYNGQPVVVMGFSPGISERLPLTASFPILIENALLWCGESASRHDRDIQQLSTGDFADVTGDSITWTEWKNGKLSQREFPLTSKLIELDRIGVWKTSTGDTGTSQMHSARESDIPSLTKSSDGDDSDYFMENVGLVENPTTWLLGAMVVLLLLESWFFHRFAVY